MMRIDPVILTGKQVRLEPLSEKHVSALVNTGQDGSIWRYLPYGNLSSPEAMHGFVKELLRRQQAGTDLPFAVIHLQSERCIGCTRYMEVKLQYKTLEVGGTWYAPDFQRTGVNRECKYLLIKHAFETLGCIRVQFKTDARNHISQRSIERMGATREGLLRNHMLRPDGTPRDSLFYSMIDKEWPAIKVKFETELMKDNPLHNNHRLVSVIY